MTITLIVAVAENGVIGRGGQLPWRLPADLKHFKAVTMGKPVLMGRRTWESIGRPLPGRRNIVVSRQPGYAAAGAEVFAGLDDALRALGAEAEVMIIGGAEIYRAALAQATRVHLTRVHAAPEGDVFFLPLDAGWRRVAGERREADAANPQAMTFETWERAS